MFLTILRQSVMRKNVPEFLPLKAVRKGGIQDLGNSFSQTNPQY